MLRSILRWIACTPLPSIVEFAVFEVLVKFRKSIGAVTFCLLLSALPAVGGAFKDADPASVRNFRSRFRDKAGTLHSLDELRGHAAVVNFWATWCGPCREEMPRLQKLSEAYASRGVSFVAISLDEPSTQGRIDVALQKSGLRVPVWMGATPETLQQLGLGTLVPGTLVLDREGGVLGRIEGEAREKDIRARLDWELGGHVGKQPHVVQRSDW